MRPDSSSRSSSDMEETGRGRIDWGQCTILPTAIVSSLETDKEEAISSSSETSRLVASQKIKDIVEGMAFDENVPLYVASIDGELVHVNEGYRQLARQCEFFRPKGRNSQDHLPDSLMAVVEEVCLVRRSTSVDEKLKVGNSIRHFRSRHFPVMDDNGEVIAIGGTYVDCTEQLESLAAAATLQQRFKDFARASSDWFWETDRDMTVTYLSDRLTALVGRPIVTLLGKSIDELGDLKEDKKGISLFSRAYQRRTPFRDQLFAMTDVQGNHVLFHLSGVPTFNTASGEFEGFRGAGMDVTIRYRVQADADDIRRNLENTLEELTNKNHQLDVASATAENALATKSEFLAGMSHELRTPLNAIIGFAEAMKMQVFGDLNKQYVSYSEDIMNAGRHLLGLINDVLDVAVLENNKIKLAPDKVLLKEVIDNALSLVAMRANQKGQDTTEVVVEDDWEIYADVRRTTQIFVNLLSNAVKFTPEKGKIGVEIKPVKGANMLSVTVWDTGRGIRDVEQELVFEKFHQSKDSVYSKREEGTGLGLHISRELAVLMGGDITLESEYGQGSRFTVTLPTAPPDGS